MDPIPGIALDRDASTSLVDQLTERLRSAITSGRLQPGDRVPASRVLAETLGVSRTVVVGAYERLLGEAFLDSIQGSGTRVSPDLPRWHREPGAAAGADRGSTRGAGLDVDPCPEPLATNTQKAPVGQPDRSRAGAPVIRLVTGLPHAAPEPPREWSRALSRAARRPWRTESVPARGDEKVRAQLAAYLRLYRGIACGDEDIVLTSGTAESLLLIGIAVRSLHEIGRPRVAVEDPGYPEGVLALEATGAERVPVGVTRDGIDLEEIRAKHRRSALDAVMLTPSHQFPMGGRLPAEDRLAILEWAHEQNVLVIEDDYDSEFRHTGAVLPAVASLDPHGVTVYVASLNKTLSPSLRCGMIVLPDGRPEVREAILHARAVAGASVAAHTQDALAEFVGSGGVKRAVARNRREYRHRRDLLLAAFAERGIEVIGADGGLHVVIELPPAVDAGALARDLLLAGVQVETLAELTVGDHARNGLALGYGAETIPRLVKGVEVVADLVARRCAAALE